MSEVENQTQTKEQLLSHYNRVLVVRAQELGLTKYKPLTRFRTHEDAKLKTETIESSIRAAEQSERAVEREETAEPSPTLTTPEPDVTEGVIPDVAGEQPAAAEVSLTTESEDKMARKKKAAKPRKARTASANGMTLADVTAEFNKRVPDAMKAYNEAEDKTGLKRYKKHTSSFGDHVGGAKQLKAISKQAGW